MYEPSATKHPTSAAIAAAAPAVVAMGALLAFSVTVLWAGIRLML